MRAGRAPPAERTLARCTELSRASTREAIRFVVLVSAKTTRNVTSKIEKPTSVLSGQIFLRKRWHTCHDRPTGTSSLAVTTRALHESALFARHRRDSAPARS